MIFLFSISFFTAVLFAKAIGKPIIAFRAFKVHFLLGMLKPRVPHTPAMEKSGLFSRCSG